MKGLALKEKAAAAKAAEENPEPVTTPENRPETPPTTHPPIVKESQATPPTKQPPQRPSPLQLHSQPQPGLLPPVNTVNMGRRVSLANGEAAKIETFIAKQRMMARKASNGVAGAPGYISPVRSPIIPQHQAHFARRKSIPYPSPIEIGAAGPNAPGSPKFSPTVRPMPSSLHLAAMRNNTRRSSVPGLAQGPAQLICSGPFTPPRMVSGAMPPNGAPVARGLGPIKDASPEAPGTAHLPNDGFIFPEGSDLSTTYLTPPSSTYLPSASPSTFLPSDGSSAFDFGVDQTFAPYTPNGPLPNPSFSFGSATQSAIPSVNMATDEQANMYYNMQNRGRLGSIASINTYTTDAGTADGSDWDWSGVAPPLDLDGFEPDARRASA